MGRGQHSASDGGVVGWRRMIAVNRWRRDQRGDDGRWSKLVQLGGAGQQSINERAWWGGGMGRQPSSGGEQWHGFDGERARAEKRRRKKEIMKELEK